MPGIYIKYDVSALKVHVLLGRENIVKMAIRMCSVISGIIVISGFINSFLLKCWESFLKTFAPSVYEISQEKLPMKHDPNKIQGNGVLTIYDILTSKESHKAQPTNINLLTNNLQLNSDPIVNLITK
jgi:hypothetical protein